MKTVRIICALLVCMVWVAPVVAQEGLQNQWNWFVMPQNQIKRR